jgi:signal transduction histidine kinase
MQAPSVLVAIVDSNGAVLSCNERFRALVCPGSDRPSVRSVPELMRFATGDEPAAEVGLQITRSGEGSHLLRLSLSRQSSSAGDDCIVAIGHDVTERLGLCTARGSARVSYETRLATDIAHEINQPLSIIRMAAQNALAELEPGSKPANDDGATDVPPPAIKEAGRLHAFLASKLLRIMSQVDRAALTIMKMRGLQ